MLSTPKSVFKAFQNLFHSEVEEILINRVSRTEKFIHSIIDANSGFIEWLENAHSLKSKTFLEQKQHFLNQFVALNNQYYNKPQIDAFEQLTINFNQRRELLLETITEEIIEKQDDKSFIPLPHDASSTKSVKKVKNTLFSIHKALLKKNTELHWKRKVPLRNYAKRHFSILPLPDLWQILEEVLDLETKCLTQVKDEIVEMEHLFTVDNPFPSKADLKKRLTQIKETSEDFLVKFSAYQKSIHEKIDTLIQNIESAFQAEYYKVGTFEFRALNLRNSQLNKQLVEKQKVTRLKLSNWERALFAESEDWSFDLDLFTVRNATHIAIFDLEKGHAIAYEKKVLKKIKEVKTKIEQIRESIINSRAAEKGLRSKLSTYRADMEKLLNENDLKIAAGDESHENLEKAIANLLNGVTKSVDAISETKRIVKEKKEHGTVTESDLITVHPKELIQFEMLPKLKDNFEEISSGLHKDITSFEINLIDIAHFVDYNFDSANAIFDQKDTSLKDAKSISDDGLQLADEKINKAIHDLQSIYKSILENLKKHLGIFEEEVISLTENEKVSELRVRLIKAKAINTSEELVEKVADWFKLAWTKIKEESGWLLKKGTEVTEQISTMYYQKGSDGQVNADISNFLAETRTAIDRLPYIYQRLFKLESVSKGYLFFKRQEELVTMRNAYHNWRLNRFASLTLIGEKGAGVTSMVQHFLMDIPLKQYTVDFKYIQDAFREQILLNSIAAQLGFKENLTKEELIEQLNGIEEKAVIILEGLQYVYLRKVDGFEGLKLFFELASKTNTNIFWVSTCTVHAWNYLEKVIRISEYMGYVVKLGEFSNDEMIEIVTKRHKVSGYDLQFLPSKEDLASKKYKKLNSDEQQDFLSKQFFQQLNQLAKGNISVALIFWLRSAHDIKDNVLMLKSMHDFDSSFIKDLEKDKLFGLHALLLHDGLSAIDFCKVLRYKPELGQIRLMQMLDDGLLLKFGERYVINFLLYRTTINALTAQNLLH